MATYETIPPFSIYGQGDAHMSLRQVLKNSGYDPDVAPFPGLMGPVFNVKAFGAVGDGVTDDTVAIAAALVAGTGAVVFFPTPSVHYKVTASLNVPGDTTLMGANKRTTKIQKAFNGTLATLVGGCSLFNLYLEGDGENFTGDGINVGGSDGNQIVADCRIINFDGPCVEFTTTTAGGRSEWRNVEAWRTDGETGTDRYAFVTADGEQLSAVSKSFHHIETAGFCSFDFGGCDDVFVGNSVVGDLKYTGNSRQVVITATRILNQEALTVDGSSNSIVGCIVHPAVTLAAGVTSCVIGPNTYDTLPIVDASANASNMVTHPRVAYTPAITASGTAPALGDGTLSGNYTREGGMVSFTISLTLGSTTTLGTGELRFSLPVARVNSDVQEVGSAILDDSGTRYTAVVQSAGALAYVRLMRDTSGVVTVTSPATWAAGDTIRLGGSYSL